MPSILPISATYRLQFNKDFTFRDAANIVDYLWDLGMTHVYASPILTSRRGSTHGYDVIDPTRLNPELGTEADFQELHEKLQKHGMGLIVDIVPNHMSASSENSWWMDVLENGPESAYASYFDIDWQPPSRNLEGKILLPVLGGPFGEVLEHQQLKLVFQDGTFFVQYFESLFPLEPSTYRRILKHRVDEIRAILGEDSPGYQEYSGIIAAASALSERENQQTGAAGARRLRGEAVKERLRQLVSSNAYVQTFLQQNLKDFAGKPGDPGSFSAIERLLAEQHYVLAYWQNINEEINYRRFFTINDLVGMRMQDPLVFEATHALICRMVEQKTVTGLRIDHIDGLRNPVAYLNRLKDQLAAKTASQPEAAPVTVFVEKILARDEDLPGDWPAMGTTGYDFLNVLNSFFVDPLGSKKLEAIYSSFLGRSLTYVDVLYDKKTLVMSTLLGVEMRSLGRQLGLLAGDDRYAREVSRAELSKALIETTAHLAVYRTYIRNLEVSPRDRETIEQAFTNARTRNPLLNSVCFDFLRDVLLLQNRPHLSSDQREARLAFVMRWQQFTGPIMAKAFEDTLLYVYHPLVSVNDVGGEPRPTVASATDFHGFVAERSKNWPHSLNATTTHDTKRSEDVRARINVLSEIPDEWEVRLRRWAKLNAPYRKLIQGQPVPDNNEELFLYQTLLGMWPVAASDLSSTTERLQEYAIKATREAMVHTRWTLPNLPHEAALKSFVSVILKPGKANTFLRDFSAFEERIAYCGMINGLSQTSLKIVSPGIPDFYQGAELWDLRLVDPDNRGPVDFIHRGMLLAGLKQTDPPPAPLEEIERNWRDGRIKVHLIWKALNFRREHSELFSEGDFMPVRVRGKRQGNVGAFVRRHKEQWLLVVVPRWLARAGKSSGIGDQSGFWGNTEIQLPAAAPASWSNVVTGKEAASKKRGTVQLLSVTDVFDRFPVALLSGSTAKRRPKNPRRTERKLDPSA